MQNRRFALQKFANKVVGRHDLELTMTNMISRSRITHRFDLDSGLLALHLDGICSSSLEDYIAGDDDMMNSANQ